MKFELLIKYNKDSFCHFLRSAPYFCPFLSSALPAKSLKKWAAKKRPNWFDCETSSTFYSGSGSDGPLTCKNIFSLSSKFSNCKSK